MIIISTRGERGSLGCRRVEEAEEAFKLRAASFHFRLSTPKRIREACLMQDNSLKFAERQAESNIPLCRQCLVKLCDASSYFERIPSTCVGDSESNDQVRIGALNRIEPHRHRLEELAQRKLFHNVRRGKRGHRRQRRHSIQLLVELSRGRNVPVAPIRVFSLVSELPQRPGLQSSRFRIVFVDTNQ